MEGRERYRAEWIVMKSRTRGPPTMRLQANSACFRPVPLAIAHRDLPLAQTACPTSRSSAVPCQGLDSHCLRSSHHSCPRPCLHYCRCEILAKGFYLQIPQDKNYNDRVKKCHCQCPRHDHRISDLIAERQRRTHSIVESRGTA